jgi:hypothetical protein
MELGYYLHQVGLEHTVRIQAYMDSYMVTPYPHIQAYHYILMVGAYNHIYMVGAYHYIFMVGA